MAAPLALIGDALEVDRLGLAARREGVETDPVAVAAGDDATLVAVVEARVAAGRAVLLTPPLPHRGEALDELVALAAGATAPVGYAEPIVVSPVAAAGLAAVGGWSLRRLDLDWRAPGGVLAVDRARAAALALAFLGGRALPASDGDGWRGLTEGVEVAVAVEVAAAATDWSLQVVADDHVARLEWAPTPGAELDGQVLVAPAPIDDAAERLVSQLGYRALVAGIAGAAAGRGGTVVPLGFARRVAAALR